MNIEIHTPYGKVPEALLQRIRKQLMQLHHSNKNISRVQVYLKESPGAEPRIRSCAIDVIAYGESVFVQRKAASFEKAIDEALAALLEKTTEQLKLRRQLPDQTTSTVKV